MDVLILGCGYVGMRIAKQLAAGGNKVYGARRRIDDPTEFEDSNVIPIELDITDVAQLDKIPQETQWCVNAVSSSRGGAEVYRQVYLQANRSLVSRLQTLLRFEHFVQISSTSVFGQTDGSWVDETSERYPSTETSRILVEAEDDLLQTAAANAFPASIARVSGIYGPERGYLFHQFLKGEATMVDDGSRIINMIHVDDIVGAILQILAQARPGTSINLTDSSPTTQREFFTWLVQELGGTLPPSASPEALRKRKRAVTNKRVSNTRLVKNLGYTLQYPTFREGYFEEIQKAKRARSQK